MSRKKKVVAKSKDHLIPHSKSYSRRKHDTRNLYKRFLIICEGTKSEPQYFKHFKHPGVKIKIIGTGKNTESLVDEAVKRKKTIYLTKYGVFLTKTIFLKINLKMP